MVTAFGVLFLVAGILLVVFAPWTAEQRASAHFSTAQLEATDPHTQLRVRRFKFAAIVLNVAVGAAIAVFSAIGLLS